MTKHDFPRVSRYCRLASQKGCHKSVRVPAPHATCVYKVFNPSAAMCGMASWQQWNDPQQHREHKPWTPVCNAIRQLVTIDQSTTHTSASCSLPAASAMDTIRACPECQEPDPSSSLSHRERVLQHFSTVPGLGPIDLVLCIKEAKGGFGEQKTSSFFHQVVGYDVCSTASLAAYFSDLCSNSEQVRSRHYHLVCSLVRLSLT